MGVTKSHEIEPELVRLLAQLSEGDLHVLSQILDFTRPRLFRFCFHLTGNPDTAEELAQETLLKGFGLIRELEEPQKIYSWLFRIAKNLFIDGWRSAEGKLLKLTQVNDEEGAAYLENIPNVSGDEKDVILSVRKALQNLPEKDRMVILLVDHEGYSYDEAAEVCGISEGALRSRLARARNHFLEIYEKEETRVDRSAKN